MKKHLTSVDSGKDTKNQGNTPLYRFFTKFLCRASKKICCNYAGSLAAVIGLVISVLFAAVGDTYRGYEELTDNVLRLHIIANSDSEYDQNVKLAVRDRLLNLSDDIFGSCNSRDDILKAANSSLDIFENEAAAVLNENSCHLPVSAGIADMHFDVKNYGDITMPQGEYTALRIVIGEGKGHNWWCVMYPPLCIPCFSDEKDTDRVLAECSDVISPSAARIMTESDDVEVRLYCAELWDKFLGLFDDDDRDK